MARRRSGAAWPATLTLAPILAVALVALPSAGRPAAAAPEPGADIESGTPVAVVVSSPSGELASWSSTRRTSGRRWTCGYLGFEDVSAPGSSHELGVDYSAGPVDPQPGAGYVLECRDEEGAVTVSRFVVYDPAEPLSGLLVAERAAELALERIELPVPEPHFSPSGSQLVGLPSWLWVADPWQPQQASATIEAVTSTVVSEPVQVLWDMGDGTTVTCAGPGRVYDPATAPAAQSTDCSHTYIWASGSQPSGAYAVTATITHLVSWTATTGTGGALGLLTRSATVPVVVEQAQAVIG